MSSKQSLHALKLQRSPSTQPVQLTICTRRRCRTNHESHTQTNRRQTIHCCRGRGPDARPHTCQRTSLQDMRPVGWPRSHNWQRMSGESCREAIGLGLALSALTTEARDIAKCANWHQNKLDMIELSQKATRYLKQVQRRQSMTQHVRPSQTVKHSFVRSSAPTFLQRHIKRHRNLPHQAAIYLETQPKPANPAQSSQPSPATQPPQPSPANPAQSSQHSPAASHPSPAQRYRKTRKYGWSVAIIINGRGSP